MLKVIAISVLSMFVATTAMAAETNCKMRAAEKKLAGAALTSFTKKCERDAAAASCETRAMDKKLAGAARTSFMKKCTSDAVKSY